GEPRQVGGGLQIDGQRPLPGRVPLLVGRIVGYAFVNPGIVDQHVDRAAELVERGVPDVARRLGVGEVARDQRVAALGRMADDVMAGLLEERVSGRADAAARAGDEDVHAADLAIPPRDGEGDQRSWWWGPTSELRKRIRRSRSVRPWAPSTTPLRVVVPLPGPGRRVRRPCR